MTENEPGAAVTEPKKDPSSDKPDLLAGRIAAPGDKYLLALRGLFWVFCFGAFAFAAVQVWPVAQGAFRVLQPFILGLILAYVLHPVVGFVQHRLKLGRGMGILVVLILILGTIGLVLAILVPILYEQIASSVRAISDFFKREDILDRVFSRLSEDERRSVREFITEKMDAIYANLSQLLEEKADILKPVAAGSLEAAKQTLQATVAGIGWIGGLAATVSLTTLATGWYLLEMSKVPAIIRRLLPEKHRERIWELLQKANDGVGGFLRGQLIACIGVGLLTMVLMFFVGPRKYAVLIGFMAGFVNFIPYLGPTVGATPAVLWALLSPDLGSWGDPGLPISWGDRGLAIALIVGGAGVIQAIDGFIFQPFIVGSQAALHPLAVMLALVVGAQFGIGGMILAVPTAAAIKVLWVEIYWKRTSDFLEKPAEQSD